MALSINTQANTNGVINRAIVNITTDAAAAAATTFTFGFTPRKVSLYNLTDRISDEWVEGMASASALHTVAAGTRTLELTNGVAVSGGSVTFTATTMVASKVFVLIAEM